MSKADELTVPYIGARYFQSTEKDILRFHGREKEVRKLLSIIVAKQVLVIYGRSGAGKTSLINAALIPQLEKRGFDVMQPVARVRGQVSQHLRASADINNIYMLNLFISQAHVDTEPLRYARTKLIDFLRERQNSEQSATQSTLRILFIDQFEELFTTYPERWQDRNDFFHQIAEALESDPWLRVVLILREDYLARLLSYANLMPGELRTQFSLERLTRSQAEIAIVKPLEHTRGNRHFSQQGLNKFLDNLMAIREKWNGEEQIIGFEEYVEPVILQVVCENLWESLPEQVVEISEFEVEDHARVLNALINFYERCLRVSAKELGGNGNTGKIRKWIANNLITSGHTRSTIYRDPNQDSIENMPNRVIEKLVDLHLLRSERRAKGQWFELVHDSLVNPILESNRQEENIQHTCANTGCWTPLESNVLLRKFPDVNSEVVGVITTGERLIVVYESDQVWYQVQSLDNLGVEGFVQMALLQKITDSKATNVNVIIDMSHWQSVSDWNTIREDGILCVFHKATQGINFVDSKFIKHVEEMRAADILPGAYHFGTGADPIQQVEHFLNTVRIVDPDLNMPLVLDFEQNAINPEASMNLEDAESFVQYIFDQTARYPILYSGNWYLRSVLPVDRDSVLFDCPLWLASYTEEPPTPPEQWADWTFWQYTNGVHGPEPKEVAGISRIDRNIFNGTLEELQALFQNVQG